MSAPTFFGRVIAREVTPDGACAIVEHEIARPLPAHDHRRAYFCLLAHGGYVETAGRRIEYQPGGVVFHPPGLHHRDEITAGRTRLVVVELDAERLDLLQDLRPAASRDVVRCDPPAAVLMSALELRTLAGARDDAGELVLELLGVLSAARPDRSPGPWLARAEELMRAEIGRPLRVVEIAERVAVHPVRLARAIRRRYRCSVSTYLHSLRIERACQALRATDAPLADIAADLGFADQSHLTRVFTARLGTPPARYRAATRKGPAAADVTPRVTRA